MQTSEQGLALIRHYEGFSQRAYRCPAGKKTIGYGHVIREGEWLDEPITRKQADALLMQDVKEAEQAVRRLVTAELKQCQFDALVSFIYNIGEKAFKKSTLLYFLNVGRPERAADEFSRWVHGGGKRLEGLVRRREAEKTLFTHPPS